MTSERQRRADFRVAKRVVQEVIHDPARSLEMRERARLAAVQVQKLIDRNERK